MLKNHRVFKKIIACVLANTSFFIIILINIIEVIKKPEEYKKGMILFNPVS